MGAPARHDSFDEDELLDVACAPWPPYSFGQPMPSQPSRAHLADRRRGSAGPPVSPAATSACTSGVISSAK